LKEVGCQMAILAGVLYNLHKGHSTDLEDGSALWGLCQRSATERSGSELMLNSRDSIDPR
jgi:hypothetical protein